jgi:GrpB-like predicted nucleotidyltransferase (UPF0157 family)
MNQPSKLSAAAGTVQYLCPYRQHSMERPLPDPEHLWRSPEAIVLAPHDPAWLHSAKEEGLRITDACGHLVLRTEHIGSTSVPGLVAKPVLDLMPILRSYDDGFACVAPMRALGYWYAGDFGIAGRHLFVKGSPRTHHAHMLVEGCNEAIRHVAVRDTLRSHPHLAERYAKLKFELAAAFGDNREGYAQAKSDFMRELFDAAGVH